MSNKASLILGTAGHIDHGKSSLIKRLSGLDPDRLSQEKERGITIELGFAEFTTKSGHHYGIVDVPGHERFVRQMVAGASGIDVALLIIAADDGVMVQTREHLAILELLGVERLIVVLTKTDLVDKDWLELVELDVAEFIAESAFGVEAEGFEPSSTNVPILKVSNETGEGFDELMSTLDKIATQILREKKKEQLGVVRLPVDRVFSISGAGTVVTGTLWSGDLKEDDSLEAVFSKKTFRARSIQIHGKQVKKAVRANRVAVNLAGAQKSDLDRGEMLATPGLIFPSTTLNVEFFYKGHDYLKSGEAKSKPFKSGSIVQVHHGTSETRASVHLFKEKTLSPGQKAFAQLRLEEPFAALYQDRFVVRQTSPAITIGGGVILDADARRQARLGQKEEELLSALVNHKVDEAVTLLLDVSRTPITSQDVANKLGVSRATVADILNRSNTKTVRVDKTPYFMTPDFYTNTKSSIEALLLALYDEHTDAPDFSRAVLKNAVDAEMKQEVFDAILDEAATELPIEIKRDRVSHKQAASAVAAQDEELKATIYKMLDEQGLAVMNVKELAAATKQSDKTIMRLCGALREEGKLVRIAGEFHFVPRHIETAQKALVEALKNGTEANPVLTSDLRDLLGISRKYAIPLLEHFDAQGISKRAGEGRVLGPRAI